MNGLNRPAAGVRSTQGNTYAFHYTKNVRTAETDGILTIFLQLYYSTFEKTVPAYDQRTTNMPLALALPTLVTLSTEIPLSEDIGLHMTLVVIHWLQ